MLKKPTLSWLITTVRPFCKNPRTAYQTMLSDLFFALDSNYSSVDTTASSRIMNGIYDVPFLIREAIKDMDDGKFNEAISKYYISLLNEDMKQDLFDEIQNQMKLSTASVSFKDRISNTTNVDDLLIATTRYCLQVDNRVRFQETLYDRGNFKLYAIAEDIVTMSLNKKEATNSKICIIPVDDEFTMKQKDNKNNNPLISKDSIHGKWLTRLSKSGISSNKIKMNTKHIESSDGFRIGKFTYGMTEFWLVPISHLGIKGKAESSIDKINIAIDAIIEEYDVSGQGDSLYIPLLGTGRARVFETYMDSLNFIKKKIIEKADKLNGRIYLIIYRKDYINENIGGK